MPLGIVGQQPLQQHQGRRLLAAIGEAAHLQHAGAAAGLAEPLLEDVRQRSGIGLGLGGVDRVCPGVEGSGNLAAGHSLAGGHVMKPGVAEGLSRWIGQPAAAGFQFAAGQGQIGSPDARQAPFGPNGGQQLPKAAAGSRLGGDLGIGNEPNQRWLKRGIEGRGT